MIGKGLQEGANELGLQEWGAFGGVERSDCRDHECVCVCVVFCVGVCMGAYVVCVNVRVSGGPGWCSGGK